MKRAYLYMTGLYLMLTALVTLDSALASAGWAPAFAGLKWMRVHFITLGVLTQAVFGLLPGLTARGLALPRPKMNWFAWLTYNGGLVILLIGLPVLDKAMIITGGTLIFIAVLALMKELVGLRRDALARSGRGVCSSYSLTRLYLAGLVYLLVGVLVGTGMWIGWSGPLGIAIPKEVHVHSNLWGYTALIFSGLLFEMFPDLTRRQVFGRQLRLDMLVFASMALGALGLVLGPWLDLGWPAVAGLILHTAGTLALLVMTARYLAKEGTLRRPGSVYLLSSYIWMLVAVVVAPLIVAKASEVFPVGEVAGNGGPILIYGWIMTFLLAAIPFFFAQKFQARYTPKAGGSWLSLGSMHLGSLLFWAALFLPAAQGVLRGLAFLFWLAGMLPPLVELSGRARARIERLDEAGELSETPVSWKPADHPASE